MLTVEATAKLLHSIVGGAAVSGARSQAMIDLLQRSLNPADLDPLDEGNQVLGFLGEALPPTARLWSKAGWTSRVRHDAAYIELDDRPPYLLVVFTHSPAFAADPTLLPFVSQAAIAAMEKL